MRRSILVLCAVFFTIGVPSLAQNNVCDEPGEAPDVIVGDLHQVWRHGTSGGVTAFSVGTTSCNVGTCWLNWFETTQQHPVIGQNMFRLKDGRFEQLGQSWLKHGFFALSGSLCETGCLLTDGTHLGVNCSDPYSAYLNGLQNGLGPKFEINPSTGDFPYPATDMTLLGPPLYKRLQVANGDLDPALNPDALYFVEGQYVTQDDTAAGNGTNNASYREVLVSGSDVTFEIALTGTTQRQQPAIMAWVANDPEVVTSIADVPGDGRYIAAARAYDLGNGQWQYEYAVHNLTSHRAGRVFSVPLPPGVVTGTPGFHGVPYHSGEPFSGAVWSSSSSAAELRWETLSFAQDPDANALRWGTLYNFRFEADRGPESGSVSLELFRHGTPGTPNEIVFELIVPALCDADGTCDAQETPCNCPSDCGVPPLTEQLCGDGIDDDCDLRADCADIDCCADVLCDDGIDNDGDGYAGCDCNDTDPFFWGTPGEVPQLVLDHTTETTATLAWDPPFVAGGTLLGYNVLRAPSAASFGLLGTCVVLPSGVSWDDPDPVAAGAVSYYLIQARNRCPDGFGTLGLDSTGSERGSPLCP